MNDIKGILETNAEIEIEPAKSKKEFKNEKGSLLSK